MASETPDPSSSELLTDFDIADVDNWDDQNDNSKEIELIKPQVPYIPSPTIAQINQLIQSPSVSQSHKNIGSPTVTVPNLEHLKRFASSLMKPTSPSAVLAQQPMEGHNYAKVGNSSQNTQGLHQTKQTILGETAIGGNSQPKQSGHALETLRALALAQEEQARKLKEEQEKALQIQQQSKVGNEARGELKALQPLNANAVPQGCMITASGAVGKQVSIPITTLKLPVTDPKGQGGKGSSVLQLRGQLVRTPDQKLMLVTEVAGKKVGYLISPQSGQLQTAATTNASQVATKANQGGSSSPSPVVQTTSSTPNSSDSLSPSAPLSKLLSSAVTSNASIDAADETNSLGGEAVTTPVSLNQQESVTISSEDDEESSLSEVATTLQNTYIQAVVPVEKKKKKGKTRKKRDKNEPVKPISPYLMFFKDVQPSVRQENPGAGLGEVSKMVSRLWEQASKEEKQVYLDRSATAKEEYKIKLAEYKASLGESPVRDQTPHQIMPLPSADADPNGGTLHGSLPGGDVELLKANETAAVGTNQSSTVLVVTSSDSSPDTGLNQPTKEPAEHSEGSQPLTQTQDPLMEIDSVPVVEAPPVRKRGRPRTKNRPPLNLPKEPKKTKKKEKLSSPSQDKRTPKLTMKINIRDSKITESPTKALEDLSESIDNRREENEDTMDTIENEASDNEASDIKPSTQPKALMTFKIPLKKQKSATSSEEKDGNNKKETDTQKQKPSVSGMRKCANGECEKVAKISKERGPLYCSNSCLVLHCKSVFNTWVDERKQETTNDR